MSIFGRLPAVRRAGGEFPVASERLKTGRKRKIKKKFKKIKKNT